MNLAALRWDEDLPQWPQALFVGDQFAAGVTEPVRLMRPEVSPLSTVNEAAWVRPTRLRFLDLIKLHANWDNRGSAAPNVYALQFAWSFLNQIMKPSTPAPGIIPLGHGGVQLIWSNKNYELEVEVLGPNNLIVYFFDKTSGREAEFSLTNDFSPVIKILWSEFKD